MKQSLRIPGAFGIALFAALSVSVSGQFNYASYTETSLEDIITEEQNHSDAPEEAEKGADCIQLECKVFKYQISCSYSDIRRPISEKKKNMIKAWMEVIHADPEMVKLYKHEIRVTEGSEAHWIPIQEQLFSCMDQELVMNESFELFILLLGKIGSETIFIATEFDKSVSPADHSVQAAASMRRKP